MHRFSGVHLDFYRYNAIVQLAHSYPLSPKAEAAAMLLKQHINQICVESSSCPIRLRRLPILQACVRTECEAVLIAVAIISNAAVAKAAKATATSGNRPHTSPQDLQVLRNPSTCIKMCTLMCTLRASPSAMTCQHHGCQICQSVESQIGTWLGEQTG
jgi:hypothetical protein